MADDFIDIDGFEDYGPALALETSSFEAFVSTNSSNPNLGGAVGGNRQMASQSLLARWASLDSTGAEFAIIKGLNDDGKALAIRCSFTLSTILSRSLGGNYARIKIGFSNKFAFASGGTARAGIEFLDTATVQSGVYIKEDGTIRVCHGTFRTATPTDRFVSPSIIRRNVRHWFEIDIKIHNSTASFELRMDGAVVGSGSSLNLRAGANDYANGFRITCYGSASTAYGGFDDMYWRDNTGGTAPFLGDRRVRGLAITSDSSVQFSPAASTVGPWYIAQTSSTNAPGANQLALMPVTPALNKTINSVSVLPAASSAGAKFKGVIYSDSSGSPGSLLSSGTEVVGVTSGTVLTLALVTPQALTAGTQYWIGYITDTSVNIRVAEAYRSLQQKKANTYTSGAPAGPLSSMTTGQASLVMWGDCTGEAVNWNNIAKNPPANVTGVLYAYNSDSTVGHTDYFNVDNLPTTPDTIDLVKVSILAIKSDAGARTMNIKLDSGGSVSNGDNAGFTPSTTPAWVDSKYLSDPAGGSWTESGVNGIKVGYEVAS